MPRTGENIYRRKDGRWEGRYIKEYDAFGKAKYGYVYAKTHSETKAKLILAQTAYCVGKGNTDSKDLYKYEYWLKEWLRVKKGFVKDSTYIRYRSLIENHINPELGKHQASRLDSPIIQEFVAQKLSNGKLDKSGGISPKTMSDIIVIIKETFKFMQSQGISINCNFERVALKKTSHEMRVLSVSEERRLNAVLFDEFDRYKLGVLICLYTGLRIGELCALRWSNISFAEKTLKVEHTMQRLQYEDKSSEQKTRIIITEPKSYSAFRVIPLPEFLLSKLKQFEGSQNAFVLTGECNLYVEPRTMQNHFKAYLKQGQIKSANFHCLRHTFATRCIEACFDVKTLSEILGHSNIKITLDKYVHSSLELKRFNMDKLQLAVLR